MPAKQADRGDWKAVIYHPNPEASDIHSKKNEFEGEIISETMLIAGINYGDEFEKIVDFLKNLKRRDKAYIAIPTRPPAEKWVKPTNEEILNAAFQVFVEKLKPQKPKPRKPEIREVD